MILNQLELTNFRNYEKLSLEFEKGKTVLIVGDNGQGKTNLLEGIYLLSVAKSFRARRSQDLIRWNQDFSRIKGQIDKRDESFSLEVFLSQPQKATKKNEVIIPSGDFVGNLNVVLFHPQDMNLLHLSPDLRRKYLNLACSQGDRAYFLALLKYNSVLKNRNQLLGQIAHKKVDESEFFFWDSELVRLGSELIRQRRKLIGFLNACLSDLYRNISRGQETLVVKHRSTVDNNVEDHEIEMSFSAKLLEKKESDFRYGYTSVGPHRDDVIFVLDGKEVETHGSRGECRTLMIALKMAEITYLKEKTLETPILLLDDVFSELDPKRQERLIEAIEGCQTFVTTTSAFGLDKLMKVVELRVDNGAIK